MAFAFGLLKAHFGLLHAAVIIGILTSIVGLVSIAASRETFGRNLNFIEA
jgi:hypothetical protein